MLAVRLPTMESLVRADSISEYLDPHRRNVSVVRATCMASALEAGGKAILRTCIQAPDIWRPHDAASALVAQTIAALAAATGNSPRSIQMSFAEHLRTTPLRYFRAVSA